MGSAMEAKSEVFGSSDEKIYVSIDLKNEEGWLCSGWEHLSFIWPGYLAGKSGAKLAGV